jgi:histone-lysine N-methyltransferase SETMAR
MEKVEYRSVIKILFLQRKTPKTIHEEMLAVYHDGCPSYDVVKHWCRQFKCGRLSIHDEPRSGRPSTSCDDDMIQKVEKMILEDRRIKVKNIAAELGISQGSVFDIIHNELNMTKVSARWIPRLLTPVQKMQRRECHSSVVACQAARESGYEILPHPPYSPDLAPSDFFLFPKL